MRALRLDFTRRPMPGMTNTPFFLVSLIAVSARCSRIDAAVLFGTWCFSAIWRTRSVLVIPLILSSLILSVDSTHCRILHEPHFRASVFAAFYAGFLH